MTLNPTRAEGWFNLGDALAKQGLVGAPEAMMLGYRFCNDNRKQKTKQLWNRLISDPSTNPKVADAMVTALSTI